jgi:hypothetical protein
LPVIVWSSMIHVSNATARTTAGWTFLTVAVNCLLHLVATIGLRGESGGVRSLAVTNLVGAVLNAGWWFAVALLAAVLGVMADAT